MKRIPIFCYGNVSKNPKDKVTISLQTMADQFRYLKSKGFKTISLQEVVQNIGDYVPQRISLTFDGGYISHYQYVFALLQRFQYKATFFIPADKIGGFSTYGDVSSSILSIEDIFEMKQWGMDMGIMAATERDLTALSENELQKEIVDSKKAMEDKLYTEIKFFCYPGGKYNDKVLEYVKKAGYCAAVSIYDPNKKITYEQHKLDRHLPPITGGFFSGLALRNMAFGKY